MSLDVSGIQRCSFFSTGVSSIIEFSKPRKLALGVGVTTITAIAIGILFGPIPFLSFGFGVIFGFALRKISNENQKINTNSKNDDIKKHHKDNQTDVCIIEMPTNSPKNEIIPNIEPQKLEGLGQELDGIHREIRGKHHQIDEKIRKMREMQIDYE